MLASCSYLLLLLLILTALLRKPPVGRGRLDERQRVSHGLLPAQLPQRFRRYLHTVCRTLDQENEVLRRFFQNNPGVWGGWTWQ